MQFRSAYEIDVKLNYCKFYSDLRFNKKNEGNGKKHDLKMQPLEALYNIVHLVPVGLLFHRYLVPLSSPLRRQFREKFDPLWVSLLLCVVLASFLLFLSGKLTSYAMAAKLSFLSEWNRCWISPNLLFQHWFIFCVYYPSHSVFTVDILNFIREAWETVKVLSPPTRSKMFLITRLRKSFLMRICLTLAVVSLLWLHVGVFIYRGAEIDFEHR